MDTKSAFVLLDILDIFSLDMSQLNSNLLRKTFVARQHAFLSTSSAFFDIFARACAEIEILFWDAKVTYVFRFLGFNFVFSPLLSFLLFLYFCCSGWPSTVLASSSRTPEKASSRRAILAAERPSVVEENFAPSFHLNFWVFPYIFQAQLTQSLWSVSLERSSPPAELK